jgi:hypothetical protein
MGALPSARIEPRPLPAEAVENAIRAARKTPAVAVSTSSNGTGRPRREAQVCATARQRYERRRHG